MTFSTRASTCSKENSTNGWKYFAYIENSGTIDVAGFFQGEGQTNPTRMMKFFLGGKVGRLGGKQEVNPIFKEEVSSRNFKNFPLLGLIELIFQA